MSTTGGNAGAGFPVVTPQPGYLVPLQTPLSPLELYCTVASLTGGNTFDTGALANNLSSTLFTASTGKIYKIYAVDKANSNVFGEWTVWGTTALNAVIAVGCQLLFSGINIVLKNTSGGTIEFVGSVVTNGP